jgi:hypothetical protein
MKWKRLAVVSLATLGLSVLGVELAARQLDLDRLQEEAIAVDGSRVNSAIWRDGAELGVAYLPPTLRFEDGDMITRIGTCKRDHPGPTVLVYGDSTTVQSSLDGVLAKGALWPQMLEVPRGGQLCGAAEVGYHPADYRDLHERLVDLVQPDLVLVVLCENDLPPRRPRTAVRRKEGGVMLFEKPTHRLIQPQIWQPQLYEASEAFRFLHWRLAMGSEDPHRLPLDVEGAVDSAEALQSLRERTPTEIFLLPPLGPKAQRAERRFHTALEAVEPRQLELEEPLSQWRRLPEDELHLNEAGHRAVAAQIQIVLDEAWP